MGQHRYATVTNALTRVPSRRDVLRGLAAVAFGLGVARRPDLAAAKKGKKRKKKAKPPRPNQYGCLSVGATCQNAGQCCSGVCEGKKCRAHGVGTCKQDAPGVCTASESQVPQLTCTNNGDSCYCFRTTAGSNYCAASPAATGDPRCADCAKDADCEVLGYPAGSACIPVALGHCAGRCPTGMACLIPCGTELPDQA